LTLVLENTSASLCLRKQIQRCQYGGALSGLITWRAYWSAHRIARQQQSRKLHDLHSWLESPDGDDHCREAGLL
jgi:hypothetical protein